MLLVFVSALSLVSPAISKKPDNTTKKVSNGEASNRSADIELYWDSRCTKRVSSIEWGQLRSGNNKSVTLFIMNKGKDPVTLSYYTSNWQPSKVENYFFLEWDYTGQVIEFREIVQVVFTLYISENVETIEKFSFDISIISTQ